jgi:hypothetical protein
MQMEAILEDATLMSDAGGCFWLESRGHRYDAVWPQGFSALDDPPRILDRESNVVATPGQVYDLGGGFGSPQGSSDCAGSERTWWVGEIRPDQ